MILRDKQGWPVVTFSGFHPITNTIRRIIHTNIRQTWFGRFRKKVSPPSMDSDCSSDSSPTL